MFGGGPCPSLYIRRDRVTWKVLAEYSWSPTPARSGSFLCTAASSMPIREVTREVRYIHELSLTLEHSMPISSPAALGLTRAPACYAAGEAAPCSDAERPRARPAGPCAAAPTTPAARPAANSAPVGAWSRSRGREEEGSEEEGGEATEHSG